jgi:hypothetical protein
MMPYEALQFVAPGGGVLNFVRADSALKQFLSFPRGWKR